MPAKLTVADALSRWSEACAAIELKGQTVRDGNWESLTRTLRHFKDGETAAVELVAEHGGSAILKITPVQGEVPQGKTPMNRPAFLILVR